MTATEKLAMAAVLLQDTVINGLAQMCNIFAAAEVDGYPSTGNEQVKFNPCSRAVDAVSLADDIYTANSATIFQPHDEYVIAVAKQWLLDQLTQSMLAYYDHENLSNYNNYNFGN